MPSDPQPHLKTVMIYRAQNEAEARIICMALEEGGVHAVIEGGMLDVVVPEVPVWDAAPRIFVPGSQVTQATNIIQQVQSRKGVAKATQSPLHPPIHRHKQELACLACGHAMDETSTACPACGWSFETR